MRPEGHAGLSLTLATLGEIVFRYPPASGIPLVAMVMVFSVLPDLDLRTVGFVEHRGVLTHSLFSALLVSALVGGGFWWFGFNFWLGFGAAFSGISLHLVGDAMTFTKFKMFWPVFRKPVGLGLFRSSDRFVNWAFAVLGVATFFYYLHHG